MREAEFNIRQFKAMYFRAIAMLEEDGGMERYWANHDAMGALEEKIYHVQNNNVREDGLVALGLALPHNTNLQSLSELRK